MQQVRSVYVATLLIFYLLFNLLDFDLMLCFAVVTINLYIFNIYKYFT